MHLRPARLLLFLSAAFLLSGCATILGGGPSQGVSISSDPNGAQFVIKASSGLQYASGATPQMISLPRKNDYQIVFQVDGYRPQSVVLAKGINGWIWGNLVIGWIVGFGVDFILGSAYKLEPAQVSVSLARESGPDGTDLLFGIVKQLDRDGRLIHEQRVLLEKE